MCIWGPWSLGFNPYWKVWREPGRSDVFTPGLERILLETYGPTIHDLPGYVTDLEGIRAFISNQNHFAENYMYIIH